jgi:hypothetical protein
MSKKMSMSEAGKLGAIASRATQQKKKQERIEAYNKNPKVCKHCATPIPYEIKSKKDYCNHSCAAKYNNATRGCKIHEKLPYCIICGNKTKKGGRKYCSIQCQANHRWQNDKEIIEKNCKATGIRQARRYLLETQGHKCAIPHCGISEWHGRPILLICDHINGNSEDWSLSNLRLICSNCDTQTPFYKNRNKGNGRHSRRQRYKDGKSF